MLSRTSKLATVPAAFVLGALSAAAFDILARHPELGAGLAPGSPLLMPGSWAILMAGGILFAAAIALAPPTIPIAHLGSILGASAFVAAVLVFIIAQPALYAGGLEPTVARGLGGSLQATPPPGLSLSRPCSCSRRGTPSVRRSPPPGAVSPADCCSSSRHCWARMC